MITAAKSVFFTLCFLWVSTWTLELVSGTVVSKGNDGWTHQIDLKDKLGLKIQWRSTQPELDGNRWLIMEVTANTNGYVGLGFSPHGGMTGADMVIGWVDSSGKGHLKDFHGLKNGMPIEDKTQDYELLHANENGEWTTIQFKRKWDTCDPQDMSIKNDTMRLIWATSPEDPTFFDDGRIKMKYHGVIPRGAISAYIADEAFPSKFPDESPELYPHVKSWDMVMSNNTVEGEHTTYFCRIVKFPFLDRKHHMIGWKPILSKETAKNVHHIVFYECMIPVELGGTENVFEAHTQRQTGRCYTKNMPPEWSKHCVTFLFVWVVGSEGEMMPEHVGSPLGEMHGGATYFMMEVHYDNPGLTTFTDSSGVRIFYTDQLRPNDGSVMLMGYRITPFLLLPPKQDNFVIHGICASECTAKTVPPGGIHIINTLLHAHLNARKLRLRHFRNGTELPLVAQDDYYDFNYQQSRTLQKEVTILPGDELITECEYHTGPNKRVVLGGLSTTQEMCQSFFIYYPRIDLMQCTSQSEFHDFFKALGIQGVSGPVLSAMKMPYDPKGEKFDPPDNAKELEEVGDGDSFKSVFDHIWITEPSHLNNVTVGQFLKDVDWTNQEFAKSVEKYWKDRKHYAYCTGHGRKRQQLNNHIIPYPTIKKPLEKKVSAVCLKSDRYGKMIQGLSSSPNFSARTLPYLSVFSISSVAYLLLVQLG